MGCDIHLHGEVKVKGKWLHYNNPQVNRNYWLFAKMADVRNNYKDIKPFTPRGLPEDITDSTRFDCEEIWGVDGHSHSYLTAQEIHDLKKWYEEFYPEVTKDSFWFDRMFGFLYGNTWDGFIDYPNERVVEDIRWVFWFDN